RFQLSMHLSTAAKLLATALGGSIVSYTLYRLIRERYTEEWVEVGTVGSLWIYPVKSCYRKEVDWFSCSHSGPSQGELADRQFVIVDEDSGMICTARQMPKLAILKVEVCARFLTVTTPNGQTASTCLDEVVKQGTWTNAMLRKGEYSRGLDCGDAIAQLLNNYCQAIHGVRMLYCPPKTVSVLDEMVSLCKKLLGSQQKNSFVEQSPFYVTTESSLESLNERLERQVTSANFRPNITIFGSTAWDEDRWAQIRFGDETVLNCDKLCTRCTVTTVDPESGVKDAAMEPVRTMKRFRPVADGRMTNGRTGPVFGVNASLIAPGLIRKGQRVYARYKY
ncbi:hypothetical protein PFISCL1PPCAC_12726, partial [Pristionchus fissidentatus]